MSDRLALANAIENAGIPRDKAQPVAHASLQCQMTGRPDDGGVAQELGRVIGGALGKRVERQAF